MPDMAGFEGDFNGLDFSGLVDSIVDDDEDILNDVWPSVLQEPQSEYIKHESDDGKIVLITEASIHDPLRKVHIIVRVSFVIGYLFTNNHVPCYVQSFKRSGLLVLKRLISDSYEKRTFIKSWLISRGWRQDFWWWYCYPCSNETLTGLGRQTWPILIKIFSHYSTLLFWRLKIDLLHLINVISFLHFLGHSWKASCCSSWLWFIRSILHRRFFIDLSCFYALQLAWCQ